MASGHLVDCILLMGNLGSYKKNDDRLDNLDVYNANGIWVGASEQGLWYSVTWEPTTSEQKND